MFKNKQTNKTAAQLKNQPDNISFKETSAGRQIKLQ